MHRYIMIFIIFALFSCENSKENDKENEVSSQFLSSYPKVIGAGAATIWNNEIYVFGGSDNYSGDSVYNEIYVLKNDNWELYDTLPDYSNWDLKLIQDGDYAYIVSGWPSNEGVIKKYHFPTKTWTPLMTSQNVFDDYGTSIAMLNNKIYHFDTGGNVDEYDISTNTWSLKSSNNLLNTSDEGLSSIVFQNSIYITGYSDSLLYNYNPSLDSWTVVSSMPKAIQASAMVLINDKIYFVAGENRNQENGLFDEIYSYSILSSSWQTLDKKLHMPLYYCNYILRNKTITIIGGLDINDDAVDIVQEINLE